jgi:hypothetical protein
VWQYKIGTCWPARATLHLFSYRQVQSTYHLTNTVIHGHIPSKPSFEMPTTTRPHPSTTAATLATPEDPTVIYRASLNQGPRELIHPPSSAPTKCNGHLHPTSKHLENTPTPTLSSVAIVAKSSYNCFRSQLTRAA